MAETPEQVISGRSSPRIVAVCGSIAVGKTTFVPLLSAALPDARYYAEDIWENPYLADFYRDMKEWAFHSRIGFLAMKAKIYRQMGTGFSWLVVDRPVNELITFARLHRDLGFLTERDLDIFLSLYSTLTEILPAPDFIVYLHCSPKAALERIHSRGRNFEQGIDLLYLQRLRRFYDEWLMEHEPNRVIEVDTEDLSGLQSTAASIASRIASQSTYSSLY